MFHFLLLSVNLLITGADGQSTIANWQNAVTDLDGCVVKIQSLDQAFQSLSSRIQTIEKKFQDSLESLENSVEEKFKVLLQTTFPIAASTVTPKITDRLTTQTQASLRYVDGVRLVNRNSMTRNQSAGRLEILYNGRWGTVCDDGFSHAAARVVCARLGYGRVGSFARNLFGPGTGPIWLRDVECNGDEEDIATCHYQGWGDVACLHNEDVSIICQGNDAMHTEGARLVNPDSAQRNQTAGRLEVLKYGIWGTVCDRNVNDAVARVACASLGFGRVGSIVGNAFDAGSGQIWLDNVVCNGNENDIASCNHSPWGDYRCGRSDAVSIVCGPLPQRIDGMRLVNRFQASNNQSLGRLEILFAGIWGTVCSTRFTSGAARVVCARLGFGRSGASMESLFGGGTGPIWLEGVNCNGNEDDIASCRHSSWGVHRCTHSQDVSIRCGEDSD